MRRIILTVLVVGSLLTGIGAASALPPGGTFLDDDGNTHEGYIEAIAAAGITSGCNAPINDRYCPTKGVTRAQMASFLVRALGLTDNGGGDWFDDDDGSVHEPAIDKLAAAGITSGCNPPANTNFCPSRVVTRAEMAAFLARAYGLSDPGGNRFTDDNGSVHEGSIQAIAAAGISLGCNPPTNTKYCPSNPVRRDQMASFLGRAAGLTPAAVPPRVDVGDVDVNVYAGDDLASMAQQYPAGTVFLVHGEHHGRSVTPKDNQVFLSAGDAVMNGDGWASRAFGGNASNVTIRGFEVKNYNNPSGTGAINGQGGGWIVESNHVHHNATYGIKVEGNSPVVRYNKVMYNGQLGLAAPYTTNALFQDNEVGYNNYQDKYSWQWEAGGSKFWSTINLTLRGNYVHHNHGPGLWSDTNNYNTLYEGNVIEDNYGGGIYHEVSYDAVMRNNTIRRNGFNHTGWLWGAGIIMASSKNIQVYGNHIEGNYNGITATQQPRYDTPADHGAYIVSNINVHDNVIKNSGQTGIATDTGDGSIWSNGHSFQNNTYIGNVGWSWGGSNISWESWRNYGHDGGGSYTP
jgi:parallel beta-helix repeat protein